MRVSIAADGAQSDADSFWSAISADGRFVVFTSNASTLVSGGRSADDLGVGDLPRFFHTSQTDNPRHVLA